MFIQPMRVALMADSLRILPLCVLVWPGRRGSFRCSRPERPARADVERAHWNI